MTGFMTLWTPCVACGRMFACNHSKVPSLRVNGVKEPLCEHCFDRWNQIHRISKGLEPIPLQPGAYAPEEV